MNLYILLRGFVVLLHYTQRVGTTIVFMVFSASVFHFDSQLRFQSQLFRLFECYTSFSSNTHTYSHTQRFQFIRHIWPRRIFHQTDGERHLPKSSNAKANFVLFDENFYFLFFRIQENYTTIFISFLTLVVHIFQVHFVFFEVVGAK